MARDQADHRVRTAHPLVHAAHRSEHIGRFEVDAAGGFFQLVRQDVEQHFRVAVGVDVAVIGLENFLLERMRVGQVAVVHQDQAIGRVDVEGLGLFFTEGVACGRVAHLAQANVAWQGAHVARAKNVAHHPLGFVHVELVALLCDDARRVLAAVLQEQQGVVDQLVDRCAVDNADDSTHG